MNCSKFLRLACTTVSEETLSHLRPWVRFSQLEQQNKSHIIAKTIVQEFERFRMKKEPLMRYIIKREEVSLVGMYLLRSYALQGADRRKLKALIDILLECNSLLYRKELWNTFLSCLCESPDVVNTDLIKELHEQMSFYSIGANATTYMYLIVLTLQAGEDPTDLYAQMVSKQISPNVSLIKSVLQNMSRCFPDNELIMEIVTFFLADCNGENVSFPLQKLTLWILWIAKDASLTPILLPMFMQLLIKQVEKLPENEKKRLSSLTKSLEGSVKEVKQISGPVENHLSVENQILSSLFKTPVIRQMEQHCWWFRDIKTYDAINKILPQSLAKDIALDRDPLPMVSALFANGHIERGMQILEETSWENRVKTSLWKETSSLSGTMEILDRKIETLASELSITSYVDRAYYFLEDLHKKEMHIKLSSLNLIICACSLQGDEIRAIETAESIESFHLTPDSSTFKFLMLDSGPLQMRLNSITETISLMEAMNVVRTPACTHMAVQKLVWLDYIDKAIDITADSIEKECIFAKTVTHLIRRLIYLGDMYSAAKIMFGAINSSLKEKFPLHFLQFVALRTQDKDLKAILK